MAATETRRDREVDRFRRDETETRRWYVSRTSRDRDVETETTMGIGAIRAVGNFASVASSLEISKKEVQINHVHPKRFHSVKRMRKSVQYIRRYLIKYAKPDVNTQRKFHMLSCSPPKLLDRSSPKFYTI